MRNILISLIFIIIALEIIKNKKDWGMWRIVFSISLITESVYNILSNYIEFNLIIDFIFTIPAVFSMIGLGLFSYSEFRKDKKENR